MEVKEWIMQARVPLAMLAVQLTNTGMLLLSRVILNKGASVFALVTYRHIVGTISVAPFALYWERGVVRKLNFAVLLWIFMVALTGIPMAIGLLYYGVNDTTAAYATNFYALVPVVTFLFSTVLRIERLELHSMAGKMKIIGTMLCLAGALTVCIYKGSSFHIGHYGEHNKIINKMKQNRVRGTLFLVGCCLSFGMWFILQGILCSAASFCLQSWSITQRGPTYPSMFSPLLIIFVTISEGLIFGESITVESLIGMVLIIVGLYSLLWRKNKDSPIPLRSETERANSSSRKEVGGAPPGPSSSGCIVPMASPSGDDIAPPGPDSLCVPKNIANTTFGSFDA